MAPQDASAECRSHGADRIDDAVLAPV